MKRINNVNEIKELNTENVLVVRINNGTVRVLAMVEENNNIDYDNKSEVWKEKYGDKSKYRFCSYGGKDWTLNPEAIQGLHQKTNDSVKWLTYAVDERQGEVSGNMFYHYESEAEWDKHGSVFAALVNITYGFKHNDEDINNILAFTNEEFGDIYDLLADGDYMIIIL